MPDYGGLLGPGAQQEAAFRGLLGVLSGIGQASAPSPVPNNFLGILGAGGQAGLTAFDAEQGRQLNRTLLGSQIGKLRQEAEQKRQLQQYAASLPPEQRARLIQAAAGINPDQTMGGLGTRPFDVQFGPNGLNLMPGASDIISQRTIAEQGPKTAFDILGSFGKYQPPVPIPAQGGVEPAGASPEGAKSIINQLVPGGLLGGGGNSQLRGDAGVDRLSSTSTVTGSMPMTPQGFEIPAPQGRQRIAPGVAPNTAFQHQNQQKDSENSTVGTGYGKMFLETQERAFKSIPAERAGWQRLDALLDKTYTGAGGSLLQDLKRFGGAIGINSEDVGEGDAARAATNELALQLRNPSGGAGMPGALSDADREFLVQSTGGLSTTKVGRKLMVAHRLKLLEREEAVAKIMRDYRKSNGRIDEGVFDKIAEYGNKNPLFKPGDIEKVTRAIPQKLPAPNALVKGQVYDTPVKGLMIWDGTDFTPVAAD